MEDESENNWVSESVTVQVGDTQTGWRRRDSYQDAGKTGWRRRLWDIDTMANNSLAPFLSTAWSGTGRRQLPEPGTRHHLRAGSIGGVISGSGSGTTTFDGPAEGEWGNKQDLISETSLPRWISTNVRLDEGSLGRRDDQAQSRDSSQLHCNPVMNHSSRAVAWESPGIWLI